MIAAAAEAFRTIGAAEVLFAEGQGHLDDNLLMLGQTRYDDAASSSARNSIVVEIYSPQWGAKQLLSFQ